MEIQKLSKQAYALQKNRAQGLGSELTQELVFLHLTEEIGEISRQLVNRNYPIRKFDRKNLKEEIAQALLDLLVLAEIAEVDLESEIQKKIEEMRSRA